MDISPPIPLLALQIKPLKTREKALPPTPVSPRVLALEEENEKLRQEVSALRGQLEWSGRQIKRYHQVAVASKAFSKDVMFGIRHFQDAGFKMKSAEKEASKEWADFQGSMNEFF